MTRILLTILCLFVISPRFASAEAMVASPPHSGTGQVTEPPPLLEPSAEDPSDSRESFIGVGIDRAGNRFFAKRHLKNGEQNDVIRILLQGYAASGEPLASFNQGLVANVVVDTKKVWEQCYLRFIGVQPIYGSAGQTEGVMLGAEVFYSKTSDRSHSALFFALGMDGQPLSFFKNNNGENQPYAIVRGVVPPQARALHLESHYLRTQAFTVDEKRTLWIAQTSDMGGAVSQVDSSPVSLSSQGINLLELRYHEPYTKRLAHLFIPTTELRNRNGSGTIRITDLQSLSEGVQLSGVVQTEMLKSGNVADVFSIAVNRYHSYIKLASIPEPVLRTRDLENLIPHITGSATMHFGKSKMAILQIPQPQRSRITEDAASEPAPIPPVGLYIAEPLAGQLRILSQQVFEFSQLAGGGCTQYGFTPHENFSDETLVCAWAAQNSQLTEPLKSVEIIDWQWSLFDEDHKIVDHRIYPLSSKLSCRDLIVTLRD